MAPEGRAGGRGCGRLRGLGAAVPVPESDDRADVGGRGVLPEQPLPLYAWFSAAGYRE